MTAPGMQVEAVGDGTVRVIGRDGLTVLIADGAVGRLLLATVRLEEALGRPERAQMLLAGFALHHSMMLFRGVLAGRAIEWPAGAAEGDSGAGAANVVRGPWRPDGAA